MRLSPRLFPALALGLLLGACSTPSPESLAQNDPWEKTNRDIFDFDVKLDHVILRPVTKGYRSVVPEFARDGLHNFVTNLNSPTILANDVLQGDGDKAANTQSAVVLVFSVAARSGISTSRPTICSPERSRNLMMAVSFSVSRILRLSSRNSSLAEGLKV